MIDFTSSLYLGLRHPSAVLGPWESLTGGRPAALEEPPGASAAAGALARLQGLPAATLLPSTLHLFWDLLGLLMRSGRMALLLDGGVYPVPRWTAQAVGGGAVHTFRHHDAPDLARLARRLGHRGQRPIIVSDGYCPACNRPAPLRAYAEIGQAHGGWLVLDDTQAIGMLGRDPSPARPYGTGGGGSLRWQGLEGLPIAVGASLAKGFGAPLAVLAGPAGLMRRFAAESRVRLHCSPPSAAAIAALHRALRCTALWGDALRQRVSGLASRLRRGLQAAGLQPTGELPFPVQSFLLRPGIGAPRLQRQLLDGGVRSLLTQGCGASPPRLTFIVNARHRECDIERAGELLAGHALAA